MKKTIILLFAVLFTCLNVCGQTERKTVSLTRIAEEWKTKTITNVPTGGIAILVERFDETWPTYVVSEVRGVMEQGLDKAVLNEEEGFTVEVDAKNGFVQSYDAGTDRAQMSACVWRRTDGHRLFAITFDSPTDPQISFACFYDYDPQKHVMTPEPEITDNIRPLFPTAYISYVLPREGKDLIVSEYSSGKVYNRIYKWDGMVPVYSETKVEPLDGQPELTFANMAGIYDSMNEDGGNESRIVLMADGTATWCMIGSLHFTEFTYAIKGNAICLSPKDVESEDDCYDYDPVTRSLKNEQGAVYYRQAEK